MNGFRNNFHKPDSGLELFLQINKLSHLVGLTWIKYSSAHHHCLWLCQWILRQHKSMAKYWCSDGRLAGIPCIVFEVDRGNKYGRCQLDRIVCLQPHSKHVWCRFLIKMLYFLPKRWNIDNTQYKYVWIIFKEIAANLRISYI